MFNYMSVQEHSVVSKENPVETTVRNIVTIKNGKGSKTVEEYMNGKLKKRGTKRLSVAEVSNIKDRKFMPGLFKDCLICKKTTRHKRKTQKNKLK